MLGEFREEGEEIESLKKKFVDKKRELNLLRKKMLEIMSLFDKGQQKGSVWLLGSREFNSFDRLVLFVK